MPETRTCPEKSQLQAMLAGHVPVPELATLTTHVEGCVSCQRTLDAMLPASRSWADVLAAQSTDREPEPGLAGVLRQAQADANQTQADVKPGEDLSFLAPSLAGNLGRLGHYEVQELIGKGGMGIVLKAFDENLHRVAALKVLAPELAVSANARLRFIREAQAAAAVSHDHVIGIFAVEKEHRPPFLAMQYVAGQSLEQKIDNQGPLGLKEILRIGMQIASGLAAAHAQGLVHRDIKPANILLENGVERVKITDFGLARSVEDASITQSGVIAGTPMYMSPEQAAGETIDLRSDLFSLGSVLYAMCTGHAPFRASGVHAVMKRVIEDTPRPIQQINAEIPSWLSDIVAKLHAKKPDERLQTAREVETLLGQHLAHLQQPASVPRPAPVSLPAAASPALSSAALPFFAMTPALVVSVALVVAMFAVTIFLQWRYGELDEQWPVDVLAGFLALGLFWAHLARVRRVRVRAERAPAATPLPPADSEGPAALRRLRTPAYGLGISGILYWASIPFLFGLRFWGDVPPDQFATLWRSMGLVPAVVGFVLIFTAWTMMRGQFYWLAVAGALVPFGLLLEKLIGLEAGRFVMTMGDWTALPFGMWALLVLTRRDVRAAFAAPATTPAGPSLVAAPEAAKPSDAGSPGLLGRGLQWALGIALVGFFVQLVLLGFLLTRGRLFHWAALGSCGGLALAALIGVWSWWSGGRPSAKRRAATIGLVALLGGGLALFAVSLLSDPAAPSLRGQGNDGPPAERNIALHLIPELRRLVALEEERVETAQQRVAAGVTMPVEVSQAEVKLFEAKILLAEAELAPAEVAEFARQLVKRHEERLAFQRQLFELGRIPQADVDSVERELIEARLKYKIAATKVP